MKIDDIPQMLHRNDQSQKSLEGFVDHDDLYTDGVNQMVRDFNQLIEDYAELAAIVTEPETFDFVEGFIREAAHTKMRWPDFDECKEPEEWFWLVGYLAGKALHAQRECHLGKLRHHLISSAAALRNWHRSIESKKKL